MYRKIMQYLIEWKESPYRKPLILQGARQVGKTYSVLKFMQMKFRQMVFRYLIWILSIFPRFLKENMVNLLKHRRMICGSY